MNRPLRLINCKVCNPSKIETGKTLYIDETGRFTGKDSEVEYQKIDMQGLLIFPGLINSHDHLLGTYIPKVGNGRYLNWKPWDEDLKSSELYKERSKISADDIYLLSYYRQILSGVTTVSDHIPHEVNEKLLENALIRVIKEYALAHECSSYDLRWGDEIKKEIEKSKKEEIPFITHIEEGFDKEAMEGVPYLKKLGGLFRNTVLVHCIACDEADIEIIAKAKSSIVWCPNSNIFMFNKTADIKTFLEKGVNVTLGTDSPMSGGMNLFDEMKFAKKYYKKRYKEELDSKKIIEMCTTHAAKAFKLEKELGEIKKGKLADVFVIKENKKRNPFEQVINSQTKDIEFVLKEGLSLFFKEKYKEHFDFELDNFQKVMIDGKYKCYLIGRPKDLKNRINKKVGFNKYLDFFPIS